MPTEIEESYSPILGFHLHHRRPVEKELLGLFVRVSTIHGDLLEKLGRLSHPRGN